MKKATKVWLTGLAAIALAMGVAQASDPPRCPDVSGGSAGDVPRGFNANQTAELASGETYRMAGMLLIKDAVVMLRVDFDVHPWLENAARAKMPFYRMDVSSATANRWARYNGKAIVLDVKAQGYIFTTTSGKQYYDLVLEPLSEPALMR